MIDRHNFWSIVSGVFTCLLLGKLILESAMGIRDAYYVENIFSLFVIIVVATAILSMHKYLLKAPVLLVMLLQYLALISSVMGGIWLLSHFTEMHESSYRDMFYCVSIPYIVLAGIYYISFFLEVKKANKLLAELNGDEKNEK